MPPGRRTSRSDRGAARNPGQHDLVQQMYRKQIIAGMARRLWVFAWMNFVIKHGPPCPECVDAERLDMGGGIWECQGCLRSFEFPDHGLDWFEQAPLTPKAAHAAAEDLAKLIQQTDGDDILMLFEGAMLFDQGDLPQWEAVERRLGRGIVLELPKTNAELAFSFGSALASESLLPSDDFGAGFGAWARDHVVQRGTDTFNPKLPSFSVEYSDGILGWSGEGRWLGADSGTLIDEATDQAPGGTMRADLRDFGGDPTVTVRLGDRSSGDEWRLQIDRDGATRQQRWFRAEGRHGERQVAASAIPIGDREAMIRLGMRLWDAKGSR